VVEQLLLVLKVAFVVLLYLFIWRVARSASRDLAVGQESMVLAPAQVAPRRERGRGRLVVTQSPELPQGMSIEIAHELVAGRADGVDIALPADGYASSRHARFVRGNDTDAVEDLRSTNGTYVNGDRVDGARALLPGDIVTIGQTQLTYER
jgi:hypothetical protein